MLAWRYQWISVAFLIRSASCHTLARLMRAQSEEVAEQPFERIMASVNGGDAQKGGRISANGQQDSDAVDGRQGTSAAIGQGSGKAADSYLHPDGSVKQISDEGFFRPGESVGNPAKAKGADPVEDCEIPVGMRKETVMNGLFQIVLYESMDSVSEAIKHEHKYLYGSADELVEKAGEILPINGTFIDIGAHIGYHTLLFAAKGYNVLAVEPMHRNLAALKASLCLNPALAPRVRIVRAALLARGHTGLHCVVRSSTFHPYGKQGRPFFDGNGELRCAARGQLHGCQMGEMNCDEPPVATLDEVLHQAAIESIDFLRVEVGGFECEVLGGGDSLWQRYNPKFLLVEKTTQSSFKCVTEASLKYNLQLVDMKKTALLYRM